MTEPRRFPTPWTIDDYDEPHTPVCRSYGKAGDRSSYSNAAAALTLQGCGSE
jgi:hypothetical protein